MKFEGLKVSPLMIFMAGFVSAVAVLGVAGAIILSSLVLKQDQNTRASANTNTNVNTAAAEPAKPTGTIDLTSITNLRGEGDLIILEYSDTECPYCKRFHTTMQQVAEEFAGQVRWGYKHLPLTSLHSKAPREALATECAAEQGKFWDYIDNLFATTPSNNKLEDAELFNLADKIGVDRAKFDECVAAGKYKNKIAADAAEAQAKGGRGTPYSLILDKKGNILDVLSGALPIDSVEALLEQYL